ncbi:hypothetical protein ElyMa_002397700 [Elysia marginata]|uniref:Attacin C-terminal domain-containing protein n=1 Tax=Elysia marginata TaxID=1093978 RepID=A0AAV4GED3_9GAST|nr:hypothetical protein ElyMa_002397700 [Elysia marginata]
MKLLQLIVAILVAAAVVVAVPVPAKDSLLLRAISKRQTSISGDAKRGPGCFQGRFDLDHKLGGTTLNANLRHACGDTTYGAGFSHSTGNTNFGAHVNHGPGGTGYGGNFGGSWNDGRTSLGANFGRVAGGGFSGGVSFKHTF